MKIVVGVAVICVSVVVSVNGVAVKLKKIQKRRNPKKEKQNEHI